MMIVAYFQGKFDQLQEYVRMFSPDALQFIKTAARQGNYLLSLYLVVNDQLVDSFLYTF